MSPERVVHTETKGEAYSALKNAIAVARAPCRALTEGRRGAHRRGNRVRTRRPGVLRATVAGGFAGRFQSRSRRRGAFPWRRRAGSRRQARRLFLAAERHALSPPRRRSRKGSSSQARPRRYARDADLEGRRAAARSAGPRVGGG